MKIFKNIIYLFLFIFSFHSCAQNDSAETMTNQEFKERINKNDSTMVILDVRTMDELKGALPKIGGAIHIPIQELKNRVGELEQFKNKEITVVCRTQNRSTFAAKYLREKGYNAKSVNGGMMEYYKK